jgi:tetratricopeptide (TPR) repeat protein/transcriptional regulator with XRE-family HTH domain
MGAGEPGSGFGSLLRRYRIKAGVTQEELADRAGLSVRAVSDMECGRTVHPLGRSVRLLADALGLPGPDRMRLIAERWTAPPQVIVRERAGDGAGTLMAWPLVPRQLPAAVQHFAGRAAELKLLAGLAGRPAGEGRAAVTATIGGMAGVGKTALALQFAHQAAEAFPDGQLFVNLRGFGPTGASVTPQGAILGFLEGLGVSAAQIPASQDAQAALYRSLLADRRVLVILDNARDEEQVRPLLPGGAGCMTVVTSRRQLVGLAAADGAHLLELDLLTDAESLELLVARLGPSPVSEKGEAAARIVALCDRLPLALAIAAARAAMVPDLPLSAVAAELQQVGRRLDGLDTEDPTASMRAVLSWSYHNLSELAAAMFRQLGLHPGPDISLPAARSLTAIPLRASHAALDELARAHLLIERSAGRFAFHDLLRAYAAEQAVATDTVAARYAATCRMLDYYIDTATFAARLLYPASDPLLPKPAGPSALQPLEGRAEAHGWFGAEHRVLLAAVGHAVNAGLSAHAWRLVAAVTDFLNRQGRWHDLVAVARIALDAASKLDDRNGQAHAHYSLGTAYLGLGNHNEARAHLEGAAGLFRRLGNTAEQARSALALGEVLRHQERHIEARRQGELALQLYIDVAHRAGQAHALTNLGWHFTQLGKYQDALTACERALSLHRELGNALGGAHTWDHLGHVRHRMGQDAEAITCYRRALRLLRAVGDRLEHARVLTRLGDAHRAVGDERAAQSAWRRSVIILDDLHHPDVTEVQTRVRSPVTAPSTAPTLCRSAPSRVRSAQ